jgi:5-methylcytosine-specific restriction endonuclease McrA
MAATAETLMAPAVGAALLNSKVLILNRSYLPVHVTSVKRAFALLYQGVARAVDEQYRTFDFDNWRDLACELHHERVGVVGGVVRVPRVLLLIAYERVPKRHVRFSRFNIYARDNNTCQYCGRRLPRTELNLDHVNPRSRGGLSTWENVVCSCHSCNRRKGGRTPEEAAMLLIRKPQRPQWTPFSTEMFSLRRYREWMPFLTTVDAAYWNTELLPD